MIGQSRMESLKEGAQNIVVGIGIQSAANWVVLPWFGFVPSASQLAGIAAIMTAVSLARSYTLRRLNERKKFRDLPAEDWEALDRIKCERIREVKIERFDAQHDDRHTDGELALGAAAYAYAAGLTGPRRHRLLHWFEEKNNNPETDLARRLWPWGLHTFKPTTPLRDCEKSAAMTVAEMARIIRLNKRNPS